MILILKLRGAVKPKKLAKWYAWWIRRELPCQVINLSYKARLSHYTQSFDPRLIKYLLEQLLKYCLPTFKAVWHFDSVTDAWKRCQRCHNKAATRTKKMSKHKHFPNKSMIQYKAYRNAYCTVGIDRLFATVTLEVRGQGHSEIGFMVSVICRVN